MAKKPKALLSLANIGQLHDGVFGPTVDGLIQEAIRDCDMRPGLKTARKVTITLEIAPDGEGGGMGDTSMNVVALASAAIPKQKTRKDRLTIKRDQDTGMPRLIVPEPQNALDLEAEHE